MKFIFQLLATAALAATVAARLPDGVQLGETFGGPHGDMYSDLKIVSPGQTVQSIMIRSSKRVDAIALGVTDPAGLQTTLYHGGEGGDKNTLTLGDGEYVTGLEAHWGKFFGKTRVKYVKFTTNKNKTICGGTPSHDMGTDNAPDGYQLGGFVGYAGNEVDSLSAIWTSIKPVKSYSDW